MTLAAKIFIIAGLLLIPSGGYCTDAMSPHATAEQLALAAPPKKKAAAKTKKSTKSSKPKTSADAKKQKKQTEQQLKKTQQQIKEAETKLSDNLRKVTRLESDIERSTANARRLKLRIDSLTAATTRLKDSIKAGEAELERLRGLYTRAVRSSRKNRREMNVMTFIFSAQTFRQAWRRMHYLEEFSNWRKRKSDEINDVIKSLEEQRVSLDAMKVKLQNLRREALAEERRLRSDKAQLSTVVDGLKGKQKELNTMLKRQQKTLQELDRQIEQLIQKEIEEQRRREEEQRRREEEQRRREAEAAAAKKSAAASPAPSPKPAPAPAPSKPAAPSPSKSTTPASGATDFAAQKGKLPSPLSHTYYVVQGFGVQKHHSIKTLEVNNPGVDLETASGATARAVYPGTVSAVFRHDGLGHVVLVRHGEYLTVYANIAKLNVAKGTVLKAGDVIGTVGASDSNPSRGQLHFEIRHEREKINPMQWLKH